MVVGLGGDHRDKVPFSTRQLKVELWPVTYHCWYYAWSPDWVVFWGFLCCKVIRPPTPCPFPTVVCGRKSRCAAHTHRVESYAAPPWRRRIYINYMNSSVQETFLFSPIYLFKHLYQYGLIDIYFILWAIIDYFVISFIPQVVPVISSSKMK